MFPLIYRIKNENDFFTSVADIHTSVLRHSCASGTALCLKNPVGAIFKITIEILAFPANPW